MTDYEDLNLTCRDCNKPFILSAKDQAFFASMTDGEGHPFKNPVRCKPCRELKKAQRMGGTFQAPQAPQASQTPQEEDSRGGKKRTGSRRRDRDGEW